MRFWLVGFLVLLILLAMLAIPFRNPFAVRELNEKAFLPADRINDSQIEIRNDSIIIHIKNASISRYGNTSSMNPLLSERAKGIEIIPSSPEDIHVGNVVTYEEDGILIAHRVIQIGNDANGKYFLVKGDNSEEPDGRIRFEQIKYVLVGILY